MKKKFPLLLALVVVAAFAAYAVAQSGRKITRPATSPNPPVQAPVFSQPDPEPIPVPKEIELRSVPAGLRERPLRAFDDSSFSLNDFRGKVIVVNVWASWCGPCRREVPEYEKVRKEYVGRNVEFIALTAEDPRSAGKQVKAFVREMKFGFRLGWADAETARVLMSGYDGIPQTLIIATDWRVLHHWDGFSRTHSGDALRAALEMALAEQKGE